MSSKIENVIYIRTANHSIHSSNLQRTNGVNYAKQQSLSFRVIEEHLPGNKKLNERTGMQFLLSLVEARKVNAIIVDSPCRISRDTEQIFYFTSLLEKHGAKLIVLDGGGSNE
jgi:DNA invertase Pin-like site-specific DNA recombinase